MAPELFELDQYTIRRRVFQLFGAGFHAYDPNGRVAGFSKQKAFRLKEDIRIYPDEDSAKLGDASERAELMVIQARQIIDFSAAYDIVAEERVGTARRKGFRSLFRDSWELTDSNDQPLARVQEDSRFRALLRRAIGLIPQTFHVIGANDAHYATLRQHFNPFVYKLDVTIEPESPLDRRMVFATAVLLAAIEGRQN